MTASLPVVGAFGKTGPAEIHRIAVHAPVEAAPTCGSGVAVGAGVAVGTEVGVGVGATVAVVELDGVGEDVASTDGEMEVTAALQPAMRLASANPTMRCVRRPGMRPLDTIVSISCVVHPAAAGRSWDGPRLRRVTRRTERLRIPAPVAPRRAPCHHPRMQSSRSDDAADDDREPETAYDLLQRGQALLERRHFAQAAIVLERADRLEPRKGSILEALGRAYFNSGQAERARAAFETLLDVDPSSHYGHYALGQSLKRLGRRAEAGTHLRLAVALSPDAVLYRDALARLG
jgi:hypothetical protein